jgi:putative redox protein
MSNAPTVSGSTAGIPYTVTFGDDLGHQWLADEPASLGGANRGPTPHHLLLSSLGACTAITLSMYAGRKGWALHGVDIELQFNPDGTPAKGGNDIRRRVALRGALSAAQRERLLEIANACPIHRVLSGEIRIATSLAQDLTPAAGAESRT